MGQEDIEKLAQCPFCTKCETCPQFQKILQNEKAGLVVYRHTPAKRIGLKCAGAGESNSGQVIYILENKADNNITSADVAPDLQIDKHDLHCPRCNKKYELAQRLVQKVSRIDNFVVMGICDHCLWLANRCLIPCNKCEEALKSFVIAKEDTKLNIKKEYENTQQAKDYKYLDEYQKTTGQKDQEVSTPRIRPKSELTSAAKYLSDDDFSKLIKFADVARFKRNATKLKLESLFQIIDENVTQEEIICPESKSAPRKTFEIQSNTKDDLRNQINSPSLSEDVDTFDSLEIQEMKSLFRKSLDRTDRPEKREKLRPKEVQEKVYGNFLDEDATKNYSRKQFAVSHVNDSEKEIKDGRIKGDDLGTKKIVKEPYCRNVVFLTMNKHLEEKKVSEGKMKSAQQLKDKYVITGLPRYTPDKPFVKKNTFHYYFYKEKEKVRQVKGITSSELIKNTRDKLGLKEEENNYEKELEEKIRLASGNKKALLYAIQNDNMERSGDEFSEKGKRYEKSLTDKEKKGDRKAKWSPNKIAKEKEKKEDNLLSNKEKKGSKKEKTEPDTMVKEKVKKEENTSDKVKKGGDKEKTSPDKQRKEKKKEFEKKKDKKQEDKEKKRPTSKGTSSGDGKGNVKSSKGGKKKPVDVFFAMRKKSARPQKRGKEPASVAERIKMQVKRMLPLKPEIIGSESDWDKHVAKKTEKYHNIILGEKVYKYIPPLIEKKDISNVETHISSESEGTTVPSEILVKPKETQTGGGPMRYVLSDRTFIEKGWTVLPLEKVVRKMNMFRMRPSKPEFDWFKLNKNKKEMYYESGERLAEIEDDGHGRWYYRNGQVALTYTDAEEPNALERVVVFSSGEPDKQGRPRPITILACFDHSGNGIVYDHAGKIRLKYNQTEGVVLDRTIGPVTNWKWHSLNDPPVLQQVMIDTQISHKDPTILAMTKPEDEVVRKDNEDMLAIEFDNFIYEKSKKETQKFKPFQIRMKALKINEEFSLRVMDQATVYLLFNDGSTNLKLNIGMTLDPMEIVDTETAEVGQVMTSMERKPARTGSLVKLQSRVDNARAVEGAQADHEWRMRPRAPVPSADRLLAPRARPPRDPPPTPAVSLLCDRPCYKKPCGPVYYYSTRIV